MPVDIVTTVSTIRAATFAVGPLRWVLTKVIERDLAVEILPFPYTNYFISADGQFDATNIRVRLVNHRTDRDEHVIGGSVIVKRRGRLWRMKTIATAPLRQKYANGRPDLWIPHQSSPIEVDLEASGAARVYLSEDDRVAFYLALEFAGPLRAVLRNFPPPPPARNVGQL